MAQDMLMAGTMKPILIEDLSALPLIQLEQLLDAMTASVLKMHFQPRPRPSVQVMQ